MSLIRICAAAVLAAVLTFAVRSAVAAPFPTDSPGQAATQLLHLVQGSHDDEDDDDEGDDEGSDDGDDDEGDDDEGICVQVGPMRVCK